MEIKTVILTQARTGSTRLPGKILMEVEDTPLLKIHLDRLSKVKNADKIMVATTINEEDDVIEKIANEWGYEVFRGSEDDVLDRFNQALKKIKPTWVVRVTSDCPLIDPKLVDDVITYAQTKNVDYCSNTLIENFPDGQDVEVFKFYALEYAWEHATKKSDREHVTPFIREQSNYNNNNLFTAINFGHDRNFSKIRMTVDEIRDFELIKIVIQNMGFDKSWEEYAEYIVSNKLNFMNESIIRNEGYFKSLKND